METMDNFVDRIGIQCFVFEKGNVLLGKRKNVFGHGSWGLPGGHLEKDETIIEAATRELFEETGINAISLKVAGISDAIAENGYHLQIGFHVTDWKGIPTIKEKDKCSELNFFPLDHLPEPIFVSSIYLLNNFKSGKIY